MQALVVDDSRTMRVILRGILGELGYTVTEASDGQDALNKMRQENGLPGFVLLDWNMPVMNGIDFLAAVRGQGVKTPFGFITTEGSDEMRKRAEDGGANFLLEKPFTPVKIANVLDQYITK